MKLQHSFDYNKIPQGQEFKARYMISLSAEVNTEKPRPRLNLAFVIDISGSMGGEKLHNVKEAVKSVIPKLHPQDIISITLFDNNIQTLIPSVRVGDDQLNLNQIIDKIHTGGDTNLSGGYENGFKLCKSYVSEKTISRIILLTDGLANNGITQYDKLIHISKKYVQQGVATTTIGTGRDYDQNLLGGMAEMGSGNTYFIENPDEAASVFNEELGFLLQLAASNCKINIKPNDNSVAVHQLNNYLQNRNEFTIGDVYGGQTKSMIVEMTLPAQQNEGEYKIGTLEITYDDLAIPEVVRRTISEEIKVQVVTEKEFETVEPNKDITVQSILLMIAKAKDLAMEKANSGDFDSASAILLRCVKDIEDIGIDDPRVQNELSEMKIRANELKNRREEYYDQVQSKRMYYEKEMMMKGRNMSYNSMMERRSSNSNYRNSRKQGFGKVIVVDIETTGLPINPNNGFMDVNKWPHMVSLSWGIYSPDGSLIEENTLIIKPEGYTIPAESEQYHGISQIKAMKDGIPVKDAVDKFLSKIEKDSVLVSHNFAFDSGVFLAEMVRQRRDYLPYVQSKNYCTMLEGKVLLGLPKNPSLQQLYTILFQGRLIPSYSNQNVKICAECYFKLKTLNKKHSLTY